MCSTTYTAATLWRLNVLIPKVTYTCTFAFIHLTIVIVKGGGKKLQDDFTAVASKGLGMGEVAVSKVRNVLKCKRLIYMGLDKWKGQQTAKVMQE